MVLLRVQACAIGFLGSFADRALLLWDWRETELGGPNCLLPSCFWPYSSLQGFVVRRSRRLALARDVQLTTAAAAPKPQARHLFSVSRLFDWEVVQDSPR